MSLETCSVPAAGGSALWGRAVDEILSQVCREMLPGRGADLGGVSGGLYGCPPSA